MGHDWDQIKADIISKTDILAYCEARLEKAKAERGEVAACCPYHDDDNPSWYCNLETGLWKCHGCDEHGSLFDLHMHLTGLDFKEAMAELAELAGVELPGAKAKPKPARPPIDEGLVKQWAGALRAHDAALAKLKEVRGLTYQTIERFDIGWDGKRYTIPVRDPAGKVVNVRRYAPEAARRKMINYTRGDHSYGSPARLYGADSVRAGRGRPVVITEGEWDRLVLEQNGFLAVTGTGGCKTWRAEWSRMLKGRRVAILMDADDAGRKAARETVAPSVAEHALSVRIVDLPIAAEHGKDVTDWFLAGRSLEDLKAAIKGADPWEPPKPRPKNGEPYNWQIDRVVKIQTDPPIYRLHVPEGVLSLSVDELLRPSAFKRAFFEAFDRAVTLPGKNDEPPWDEYLNTLMAHCELVPMPQGASLKEAVTEFLAEHLAAMPLGENASDLHRGRAVPHGQTRAFKLRPVYLETESTFHGVKFHEVTNALRELGCEGNKSIRMDGFQCRAWLMPPDLVRRLGSELLA